MAKEEARTTVKAQVNSDALLAAAYGVDSSFAPVAREAQRYASIAEVKVVTNKTVRQRIAPNHTDIDSNTKHNSNTSDSNTNNTVGTAIVLEVDMVVGRRGGSMDNTSLQRV